MNTLQYILLGILPTLLFAMMPVHAEETAVSPKIKQLVEQLADENYAKRQQAVRKLLEMGEDVEAPLKKLRNHPDPEVRSRIEGVFDYLSTLRKELKWLDPDKLGKPGHISVSTGRSVRLTFRNLTKEPVRIFWINTDGSLQPWRGVLKPGESAVCSRSYHGHAWLVADVNKKHLGIYMIDIDDPVLAVRDKEFKK